ncbi:unnamed protein product [Protopolystoma xenopodis]|uniref:Uncharacterized protein n=1 Tax=Protopolystoma xenopodis TaxID=117903 RepID=A0A3S5B1R8_9PLAT|nr:unnamed protein product [Protopolystoma xenopodis]
MLILHHLLTPEAISHANPSADEPMCPNSSGPSIASRPVSTVGKRRASTSRCQRSRLGIERRPTEAGISEARARAQANEALAATEAELVGLEASLDEQMRFLRFDPTGQVYRAGLSAAGFHYRVRTNSNL